MATTDPVQQMAEEIRTLQSRIGNLQDQVRLTDAQSRVSDLNTAVSDLVPRLATLRTRGYVFGKDLENQAQALIPSWGLLFPNLQSQVNAQSSTLLNTLLPIEMQIPQLTAVAGNPVV